MKITLYCSGSQNKGAPVQNHILPRPTEDVRTVQEDILSSDSATLDNFDNKTKSNNNVVSIVGFSNFV